MIIQLLLIAGLASCLLYAFVQRQRSRPISVGIAAVAIAGIYFVLFPAQTAELAHLAGVGRGADLVLYCWLVISFMLLVNLQFRILALQGTVTTLAREITLLAARQAAAAGDRPAGATSRPAARPDPASP